MTTATPNVSPEESSNTTGTINADTKAKFKAKVVLEEKIAKKKRRKKTYKRRRRRTTITIKQGIKNQ